MNQSPIVHPYLLKAGRDLEDATGQLGQVWCADTDAAVGRLTDATEALTRAIASVSQAVERLAELVED
jgi:hypothetical protein